jgi:hypothetical protein
MASCSQEMNRSRPPALSSKCCSRRGFD